MSVEDDRRQHSSEGEPRGPFRVFIHHPSEPAMRKLLGATLESLYPDLSQPEDDVLELLRTAKREGNGYDLLITNYGKTGESLETITAAKEEGLVRTAMIITGNFEVTAGYLKEPLREAGVDLVIPKPFSPRKLLETVEAIGKQPQPPHQP